MNARILVFLMLSLFLQLDSLSQTCCSAGAPITTGIGFPTTESKEIYLSFQSIYSSINRLVSENQILQNDDRSRLGFNHILTFNYAQSSRFSFGFMMPFRFQQRSTSTETQNSFGIADPILIATYKLINNDFSSISFVAGLDLAIGNVAHSDMRQITLSPDMQSGSGTSDFIFQLNWKQYKIWRTAYNFETSIFYRLNGTNQHFGDNNGVGGRAFKFGNEKEFILSLSRDFVFSKFFLTPNLQLQYRQSNYNEEQGVISPNSGGHWVNIRSAMSIIPNNKVSYLTYVLLSPWQHLNGTQITTNLEIGVQFSYRFIKAKNNQL